MSSRERAVAAALKEWKATRNDPNPITKVDLARKHGLPRSTLGDYINGGLTKAESVAMRGKLTYDEEMVMVQYLIEAARRGFPDTCKRAEMRANQILRSRKKDPDAEVSHSWLDRFMDRHSDQLSRYWSTTLTTVRGGALNQAAVDAWFNLLQEIITEYNISPDMIFAMDETCCFLDKNTHKTRHIGPAGIKQQMALHNENRETVTLIPIVSASGKVYPPTIIFKGAQLKDKNRWLKAK